MTNTPCVPIAAILHGPPAALFIMCIYTTKSEPVAPSMVFRWRFDGDPVAAMYASNFASSKRISMCNTPLERYFQVDNENVTYIHNLQHLYACN